MCVCVWLKCHNNITYNISLSVIGYHSLLVALVFHHYLCLLSHFSTHHPLFHLCHDVFDLLCFSRSPPAVSIINLSLSPT